MDWSKICSQLSMSLANLARVLNENEDRFDYEFAIWKHIADGLLSNDIHLLEGDTEKIYDVFAVRSIIGKKLTTMELAQCPEFLVLQQVEPYFSHSNQIGLDTLTQIESGLCNEIEKFTVLPIEVIVYLGSTDSGKRLLPPTLLKYLTQHSDILVQIKAELSNAGQKSHPTIERWTEAAPPQPPAEVVAASAPLLVPHTLWAGKTHAVVRNNMRHHEGYEGFSDAVIAYVLFNWCGLKNKTQIGRLLGEPEQNDSTYLRYAKSLLSEASKMNITTA